MAIQMGNWIICPISGFITLLILGDRDHLLSPPVEKKNRLNDHQGFGSFFNVFGPAPESERHGGDSLKKLKFFFHLVL